MFRNRVTSGMYAENVPEDSYVVNRSENNYGMPRI